MLAEVQTQGNTSTTTCFVTDGLGSILLAMSNTAGTASLLSSQLFAPYGVSRYGGGTSMSSYTSKGFTGQYSDAVTGLDYYGSRYYDPVSGVFLSADNVEGNMQGLNPYAYVGGNPETATDPTGQRVWCGPGGCGGSGGGSNGNGNNGNPPPPNHGPTCGPDSSLCDGGGSNPGPRHTTRQLTSTQLAQWCVLNDQCLNAIGKYQEQLQTQAYINSAYLMMGFFEFFHGDPEAFEQAVEEEPSIWEMLAQNEDINLNDKVSAALNSPDEAKQLEGQLGAIIQDNSELIRFQQKFGPRGSLGEIDAESPEAIFEAKSGGLKGEIPGLISKFENRITNPDGKPFVIYAPGWNEKNAMTVYENLGSLDTGQPVYVTTNPTQLIEVIEYLQEGSPSF